MSIYFIHCDKCGKNYNFSINNPNKAWGRKSLHCSSNKSKKNCQNENIFCEIIDEILSTYINRILSDKKSFIKL